ncbi:bZIP transcription factor 60 [Impatiens glandulifera]|uniref:bZIP transcription factor 60 n=1 Tax=Impatiens glandulifera TaxID=253017 RepID=UPI001FB0A5CF|nr:bZIP transcription factor 60 [Impatiens glandulifera]
MSPIDDDMILFDFDVDLSFFSNDVPVEPPSCSPESGGSWSMEELEHLLMDDGNFGDHDSDISYDFLSDILLDAPAESDRSAGVVEELPGNISSNSEAELQEDDKDEENRLHQQQQTVDVPLEENVDSGGGDPICKKRNRQLRNRDAAMRSRERRKSYVKDLEIKSRYFEGECRRLGMLFHSCMAENQALRLSLQNAKVADASRNYKQESAVLLLESLLLGSLLWFLGIYCLLIPSRLPKLYLEAIHLLPENEGKQKQESLGPRKPRSEGFDPHFSLFCYMSKRCKASRWRMKQSMAASATMIL